ncbi:MAG: hypothetical protein HN703_02225 [Planctomycetaceae bacterium]|jgi:hypothetical protein|nr:hypothetical protein [Planctomycetaceae bacterium]
MPSFDFITLLWWGLPLAAVPIVIHLINLLRHRIVRWPAMEFLLASQRKYRTRILLRQLLLLLLRVLAIVGLVLLFAQPRWVTNVGSILGSSRTRHVVLLDDSYSMGEVLRTEVSPDAPPTTAMSRGCTMIERLLEELVSTSGQQDFSLGRISKLTQSKDKNSSNSSEKEPEGNRFDIYTEIITPKNVDSARVSVKKLQPSANTTQIAPAIRNITPLFSGDDGSGVLWLLTDLRKNDWTISTDIAEALKPLADQGIEIHIVDTATAESDVNILPTTSRPNLVVERIEMIGGTPVANVLLPWEVTVRNYSSSPSQQVSLAIQEDLLDRPGVQIDPIPPGDIATIQFESRFQNTGRHTVQVQLPADRLSLDNDRTATVKVVEEAEVLVITTTSNRNSLDDDSFYLTTALNPGTSAATGLRPRIEPPRALTTLDLNSFDSVWLLDVPRLDAAAIRPLEDYAQNGGGVVFFVGPNTDYRAMNESMFRDGKGLFPVPLAGAVDLLKDQQNPNAPDITAEDHPVVAILSGRRNPFLDAVNVDRYMAVERTYQPPVDSGLRRLLSLRNNSFLAVEKPFGKGMGVAFLSTAAPTWNNWARNNPSWVVVILELERHLARLRRQYKTILIGQPIEIDLEQGIDQVDVDFLLPPENRIVHEIASMKQNGNLVAVMNNTLEPGIYKARWQTVAGVREEWTAAVNINPTEGNLERLPVTELSESLPGISFLYDRADSLKPTNKNRGSSSLVQPVLLFLLITLLCEQLLSYSVSYHRAYKKP